jgi:hexosaminidase
MTRIGKHIARAAAAAIVTLSAGCGDPPPAAPPAAGAEISVPVIPAPRSARAAAGTFHFDLETRIVYANSAGQHAAQFFVELARQLPGYKLSAAQGEPGRKTVSFALDPAAPETTGSYTLRITPDAVTVRARDASGLLHGGVTLWQLLTGASNRQSIAAMTIEDAPRFRWRGLMLDSARHYQSPEFIKRFIDWMAMHKLNVLHWHLTDDQAWRLEIRKYPRLTSVGAWRVPAGRAAQKDIDPKTGKPRLHGGFYTQQQVRDIVAHATARGVTVVPEIEMPGHASAAIVAYPELGVAPFASRLEAVPSDWGVYENLFNVEEPTFTFLENVLTEAMELFPGEYLHVGGDEAVKPQWEQSPRVRARMKELGVPDAHALQSYFTSRMGRFIHSKNRRLIGWDEILEGGAEGAAHAGLPPGAAVMSWRGIDGAVAAARAGHDTVLSPAPDLYFDHWQSPGDVAPGRGDTLSLEMVYRFEPLPAALQPHAQHLLGLQANLWTEHMRTEQRVEYMAFPRVAALAEVAWSVPERMDWAGFQKRLEPQLQRYFKLGITAAREVKSEPGAKRRLSHDLEQCSGGYLLSLEDDAPIASERAAFLVNLSNPCWIWRAAPLDGVKSLRVSVGQIPFNFQIGADARKIPLPKPATRFGELEVRIGGCDSTAVEVAPLEPAAGSDTVTQLPPIVLSPQKGAHDLCFRFTRAHLDPMWVVDLVELAD